MWNYINHESEKVEEKKAYTSFPEPTGKADMTGLISFESVVPNCTDVSVFFTCSKSQFSDGC